MGEKGTCWECERYADYCEDCHEKIVKKAIEEERERCAIKNIKIEKDLVDKSALFLEESFISGDTMVEMDHNLNNLPKGTKGGNYYLHDIMAQFALLIQEEERKKWILSKHNPTHERVGDNCGGVFNKVNEDGEIICAKCKETLSQYFDEIAETF